MTYPEVLGSRLNKLSLMLDGCVLEQDMVEALKECVELMEMRHNNMEPGVWRYPLDDDSGGVGYTICQPLVESFIVADAWPCLNHTYIELASCKRIPMLLVIDFWVKRVGVVLDLQTGVLGRVRR